MNITKSARWSGGWGITVDTQLPHSKCYHFNRTDSLDWIFVNIKTEEKKERKRERRKEKTNLVLLFGRLKWALVCECEWYSATLARSFLVTSGDDKKMTGCCREEKRTVLLSLVNTVQQCEYSLVCTVHGTLIGKCRPVRLTGRHGWEGSNIGRIWSTNSTQLHSTAINCTVQLTRNTVQSIIQEVGCRWWCLVFPPLRVRLWEAH